MSAAAGHSLPASDWDEERTARACLSGSVEPASPDLVNMVKKVGAARVWHTLRESSQDSPWSRRARNFDLGRSLGLVRRDDLRFMIPGDPDWVTGWDDLDNVGHQGLGGVPLGVWVVGPGAPGDLLTRAVAIVGSRASTSYGERAASDLGADLAAEGWTVLSGGAYGIDAASHRGALSAGGPSVAILAGGLDEWYPRGNTGLLGQMAATTVVMSEVAPGVRPVKAGFLGRNRLLAAGSSGTVIVEAAQRSGALNTVAWAHAVNRPVMAVPGPVSSSASWGPHDLIRNNKASLVTSAADVTALLGPIVPDSPRPPSQPSLLDDLDPDEVAVREALPGRGSSDVDGLADRTGLRVPVVLGALASLEQRQLAKRRPDGTWALARPPRA